MQVVYTDKKDALVEAENLPDSLGKAAQLVRKPINRQREIFEKIWREIFMTSPDGSSEVAMVRDLKLLSEKHKKTPNAICDEQVKLERLIKVLEGPIHIFAYLPAKYITILPDCTRIIDYDKFKRTNDYYFGLNFGRPPSLVELAKRSIADLATAIQLLENPLLDADQKDEYGEYISSLSERIVKSGIVTDFEELDRQRYLGVAY